MDGGLAETLVGAMLGGGGDGIRDMMNAATGVCKCVRMNPDGSTEEIDLDMTPSQRKVHEALGGGEVTFLGQWEPLGVFLVARRDADAWRKEAEKLRDEAARHAASAADASQGLEREAEMAWREAETWVEREEALGRREAYAHESALGDAEQIAAPSPRSWPAEGTGCVNQAAQSPRAAREGRRRAAASPRGLRSSRAAKIA